jgi:hypothetical protein
VSNNQVSAEFAANLELETLGESGIQTCQQFPTKLLPLGNPSQPHFFEVNEAPTQG